MEIKAVIEKVQKLLSLSKSDNIHEATAAARQANRLIDQHRLTMADLETETQVIEDPLEEDSEYIYTSGKVTPWKIILLNNLAHHYGLYHYNSGTWETGRKISRFKLIGRRSDIAVARYMFAWLVATCQRLANLEAKGKGRVFVSSYCEGFVQGVNVQMAASREELKKQATSSAIVKIDNRGLDARSHAYKVVKGLYEKQGSSARRLDPNAYTAGKERGKNVHLGASLGAGKNKLLGLSY